MPMHAANQSYKARTAHSILEKYVIQHPHIEFSRSSDLLQTTQQTNHPSDTLQSCIAMFWPLLSLLTCAVAPKLTQSVLRGSTFENPRTSGSGTAAASYRPSSR